MTTGLHDPCNHVPEISPGDDWGDLLEIPGSRGHPVNILPPRKRAGAPSGPSDAMPPPAGLRIEAGARNQGRISSDGELEVREISGEVHRLAPEESEIQRPPRKVTFEPRQSHVRPDIVNNGENKEWGRQTASSYRWMIAGSGLVLLCVATGLALQPLLNKPTSKGGQTSVSVVEPELGIDGMDALNELILKQPEAEAIFSRFAKAADPGDCLPWIRNPLATEPLIRNHRHRFNVEPGWTPPRGCAWNVFDVNGLPCATLDGDLAGFKRFSACFVLGNQGLLLDWKATTGYGTATFPQLASGSGDPAEIRGWIQPATHYTAVFSEADFAAFQLLPPEDPDEPPVWCYAGRNSAAARELATLFPTGGIVESMKSPEKVTLMLQRGDPSSAPNQWLVVKLLHKQWISP